LGRTEDPSSYFILVLDLMVGLVQVHFQSGQRTLSACQVIPKVSASNIEEAIGLRSSHKW